MSGCFLLFPGAVPLFLQLLNSPHQNVCEQAVWALGNIIGKLCVFKLLLVRERHTHRQTQRRREDMMEADRERAAGRERKE